MKECFKFNLGSEVKDKITGFKGIIRGRTQYLTGCNTYGIQSSKLNKEGIPYDWRWFDEDTLTLIKDKKVVLYEEDHVNKSAKKKVGGPLSQDQYPKIFKGK
jgi:hypothetical protein